MMGNKMLFSGKNFWFVFNCSSLLLFLFVKGKKAFSAWNFNAINFHSSFNFSLIVPPLWVFLSVFILLWSVFYFRVNSFNFIGLACRWWLFFCISPVFRHQYWWVAVGINVSNLIYYHVRMCSCLPFLLLYSLAREKTIQNISAINQIKVIESRLIVTTHTFPVEITIVDLSETIFIFGECR